MKKKLFVGLFIFISGFFLLFIFRLIYGYFSYPDITGNQQINNINDFQQNASVMFTATNYATRKYKENMVEMDQKYEKIATLFSQSSNFSDDDKRIRDIIEQYNALIQHERKSGLPGSRSLYFVIGVPPQNFDKMINDLKQLGKLMSINIQKIDKTNEYKELKVKQVSLIKTRDALIELKNHNAKVEELMKLEEKILNIENEIQSYGVNLGEFDEENEFCTVNFTLREYIKQIRKISLIHRTKVAFEWSVKYYFILTVILLLGILLLLILFVLLDKLKIFKIILDKFND